MKKIKTIDLMNNKKAVFWLNIAVVPFFFLFLFLFYIFTRLFTQESLNVGNISLYFPLILLILLITLTVLHEGIHGLFFKLLNPKGKVKFGFKNGMAYATSPGSIYTKTQFILICLAPFVLITTVSMLVFSLNVNAINLFGFICLISLQAAASVGDFYLVYLNLTAPKNSLVEDTEVGMNIYQKTAS